MEYHALFLPLLGGFLFYHTFLYTSFLSSRQSAQKLLFAAAAIGLVLLIVARSCIALLFGSNAPQTPILAYTIVLVSLLVAVTLISASIVAYLLLAWAMRGARAPRYTITRPLLVAVAITAIYVALMHRLIELAEPLGIPLTRWNLIASWALATAVTMASAQSWARRAALPVHKVAYRIAMMMTLVTGAVALALVQRDSIVGVWEHLTQPLRAAGTDGLGAAFLACLLGPVLGLCANLLYSKQAAAVMYIKRGWATGLELLIFEAHRDHELLMITMSDGKVYVGRVDWDLWNPRAKDCYINVWPIRSGYRDRDSHRVKLTTEYDHVVKVSEWKRFQKVLPVEGIASASLFDPVYFERFSSMSGPRRSPTGAARIPNAVWTAGGSKKSSV